MDYELYAKEVIALYPISNPQIEFIRHNENITYKVTDTLRRKAYLLRIHRPVNDGMYGDQHTFKGLKSEVKILQDLSSNLELKIQKPVANLSGEYVTAYNLPGLLSPCFSTVIEWIEGSPLTLEEDNIEEIVFRLGEKLAIFHDASRQFKFEKDFIRPMYGIDRIELAMEQIKYGVDMDVFSKDHYETMRQVADVVKSEIKILEARNEAWGIIHADIQLGNIIVSDGEPSLIDFCFSGFGYYLFDLGSAATILESCLRKTFLAGYASKSTFSFDDTRYIEGLIFSDLFISYPLFLHDERNWGWIKDQAKTVCDTLCKDFLEGKEVFYSF